MELVYNMEKKLYHDNVISLTNNSNNGTENAYSNKSIIQLESTLFKLASNTSICNGIIYIFPVQLAHYTIVRYIYFILLYLCNYYQYQTFLHTFQLF